MSELSYASGTGVCQKCGQQLLQLEDDGTKTCIVCKSKRLISEGPQVPAAKPSEEQMAKVLAAAGISVKSSTAAPETQRSAIPVIAVQSAGLDFQGSVEAALKLMKNLPMPKDVKQFKTISKIIGQMEGLLESKNG